MHYRRSGLRPFSSVSAFPTASSDGRPLHHLEILESPRVTAFCPEIDVANKKSDKGRRFESPVKFYIGTTMVWRLEDASDLELLLGAESPWSTYAAETVKNTLTT